MGTATNRTTKAYLRSINTPDYPESDWIHNSSEAGILFANGVPRKYWKITGDLVEEMNASEKAIVDQTIVSLERDRKVARFDHVENDLRQIIKLVIDEINILRQQFNATTRESNQLTDTNLADRTMAQVKTQLRGGYGN